MSGGFAIVLGAQGLVFLAWGIQMFRCLFRLRAHAVAKSGKLWPGPIVSLRSFKAFVTEPEFQRDRRMLAVLTALLFVLIGGVALVSGQSPR